jgi:anti-anti-sigma factor
MAMIKFDDLPAGDGTTLQVTGDIDSSNAAELRENLRRAAVHGAVVIDLRTVPFMDSAGLGALICGVREIRTAGGRAALCVRRGSVQRLLSVTGFYRVVPIGATVEEAHAAITVGEVPEAVA